MDILRRTRPAGQAAIADDDAVVAPPEGAYLTDGTTLFCVGHALSDSVDGELLLELEDCASSDVVLCPIRVLSALGLRPVTPAIGVCADCGEAQRAVTRGQIASLRRS